MSNEEELTRATDEQLARAFVSQVVADMEKSVNDELKIQFQGAKQDVQLRLMVKAANKKKAVVTKAFANCLEKFLTLKEMQEYMDSAFPEGNEKSAFQACMQGLLKFGQPSGENDNDVLNMQSYLRFSAECQRNRMKGRVTAMQKDQKK